jgi:aryl-alcohol dehydrogenase-like predicted oxidoreductase
MRQRKLGKTNIRLSEIGLGCASYWGKKKFDEKSAINIVAKALDAGVNLFDTGHSYSDGHAEFRLGKAIGHIQDKSGIAVSTKAGTRIAPNGKLYKDFTPEWIRASCLESLRRTGVESIALFHLHGPSVHDLNAEVLQELQKLKSEGLVQSIGVNSFDDAVLNQVLALECFDFVMPDYNILSREREPLIDRFYEKGVGVVAGAALADSLFSNRIFKVKSHKDLWYLARALKNFRGKLIKGFSYRFVNDQPEMTGPQVALAYILENRKVSSAVFGTTSEKHLLENMAAAGLALDEALLNRIRAKQDRWFI